MAFEGINAVVTGGASGLGRALSLEIARRGGAVMIADVDLDGANETADLVRDRGGVAHIAKCDVRQWERVEALAERAKAELGPIDLLCNNAGIAVGGPFEEIDLEYWEHCVDINLWGVIYGCRAFLPAMRERRRGYVLNVASAAGLLNPPGAGPYNVTKSGVVGLSETLYAEYGPDVHVGVLCPTFFQTGIADNAKRGLAEWQKKMVRKAMARSKVQAPDVARLALEGLERGDLHIVPMRDGLTFWRLKRLRPRFFQRMLGKQWAKQRSDR